MVRIIKLPHTSPEVDRAFARVALQEAQAHSLEVLALLPRKFFRLWFGMSLEMNRVFALVPQNRWAKTFVYILQGGLLLFAGYGILRVRHSKLAIFPLVAVVAYTALVHTLIIATLRHSMPLVPVLMLFATIGIGDIGSRCAKRLGDTRHGT